MAPFLELLIALRLRECAHHCQERHDQKRPQHVKHSPLQRLAPMARDGRERMVRDPRQQRVKGGETHRLSGRNMPHKRYALIEDNE